MDDKERSRMQLNCLYDMFRERVEENVVYIVYSENEGRITPTIEQLMSIAACSFTGYDFKQPLVQNGSSPSSISHPVITQGALNSQPISSNSLTRQSRSPQPGVHSTTATSTPLSDTAKSPNVAQCPGNSRIEAGDDDEPEDLIGATIDERIKRLQASVENLQLERKAAQDKATYYLGKKMFPVTSYYSDLASQMSRMIVNNEAKIVDLFLKKHQNSNSIDLHGLSPLQARSVVNELLRTRRQKLMIDRQGEVNIDIITGWGKHSANPGHDRVRPVVVSLLIEHGCEFYKLNKGALRVTISRR